jgi:PAS domain S-box-containing protein
VAVIVAAALVTVTTLLLATYGTVAGVLESRREHARLRNELAVQADQLSMSLASPAWNIDRAQIDKIIEGLHGLPAIYGVVVQVAGKTHARVRDARWQLVPTDGTFAATGLLAEERPIAFAGERIGTVRVYVTPRFVERELRNSVLLMVVTIVAIDLLLTACIYFVLWRAVLRPLTEVEQYASTVSTGGRNTATIPAAGRHLTAELESLRSSIETMVHLLDLRYAELQEEAVRRKQTEDDLKVEKDFTDTAINAMTGLFFVQDRQGRNVRWNQTMGKLLRQTYDGAAEFKTLRLIHPDDRPLVTRKVAEVFEQGYAEVEARLETGSGEERHFLLNAQRMDVGGEAFLVGTGTEITARRRAEVAQQRLQRELERSEADWKQTFDTVPTPILLTEENGTIVRVNRAALELCDKPFPDLLGKRVQDIGSGEPWQTAAQLITFIADNRSGTSAETKDAHARTWDLTVSHFSTPENGGQRFILVLWEITGIVEMQESLRRSETLSAMGTLVAGVAHEVRNPLFGISATLDAYHEELSRADYAELGATLRREVNRLIHLMQELLEYGKPPAMSIERGSVADVVRLAADGRRQAARNAQVEIRTHMTAAAPSLLMDRSRLRQVFENLIDNAIQHSHPSGLIEISDSIVDHAGRQWLEFRVEDQGPGFAPGSLSHVFEPFFTQRDGGTGLGLSIVQRIVEEHSGKVTAANLPGGGAQIRVLFPL